ncbi:hypothetical protein JW977_04195 [Candidatus Falkowbacteria bacterium]|nr:hypothetical protein [Candidatus Falkowbacteria bacterium]
MPIPERVKILERMKGLIDGVDKSHSWYNRAYLFIKDFEQRLLQITNEIFYQLLRQWEEILACAPREIKKNWVL